jgi:hypothetical protein
MLRAVTNSDDIMNGCSRERRPKGSLLVEWGRSSDRPCTTSAPLIQVQGPDMAKNEIQVHLVANGVRAWKEPVEGTLDEQGSPIHRVRLEIIRPSGVPSVPEVAQLLKARGFLIHEESGICLTPDTRTRVSMAQTPLPLRQVLEVQLNCVCSPTSNTDLHRWIETGEALVTHFSLSPLNYESLTAYDRVEDAITTSTLWKGFSARYGW